jgi:hypothetical protein
MKASKREPANLPKKLAEAFLGADPAVREAIRKTPAYQSIVGKWANQVGEALNGPRTTIHPGDQGMRELFRLATALPPDLAQDLVVAATPAFVNCSNAVAEHNKGDGAIFSSKDRVPVSKPSPDIEASKPGPDREASKPTPDVETSNPNPDDEASKPAYIGDLKAWIERAEVPNPRAALAIEQLERLIDKS